MTPRGRPSRAAAPSGTWAWRAVLSAARQRWAAPPGGWQRRAAPWATSQRRPRQGPQLEPRASADRTDAALTAPSAEPRRAEARRTRCCGDRGVSILEFAGFMPVLLVIGMAAIQLGLVGYAVNQAGSGARAAARVASQDGAGEAAGVAAMSDWLDADVSASKGGGDTTTATVTVDVPGLIPFVEFDWKVVRHATMPNDD